MEETIEIWCHIQYKKNIDVRRIENNLKRAAKFSEPSVFESHIAFSAIISAGHDFQALQPEILKCIDRLWDSIGVDESSCNGIVFDVVVRADQYPDNVIAKTINFNKNVIFKIASSDLLYLELTIYGCNDIEGESPPE